MFRNIDKCLKSSDAKQSPILIMLAVLPDLSGNPLKHPFTVVLARKHILLYGTR